MNGQAFIEFVVPFIRNALAFQRKMKAFIMNGTPLIEFVEALVEFVRLFSSNVRFF
jgi:hypothetical protein